MAACNWWVTVPLRDNEHYGDVVEGKPASLLFVLLGQALNRIFYFKVLDERLST